MKNTTKEFKKIKTRHTSRSYVLDAPHPMKKHGDTQQNQKQPNKKDTLQSHLKPKRHTSRSSKTPKQKKNKKIQDKLRGHPKQKRHVSRS